MCMKKYAAQFGLGWSNYHVEISVIEWFREKNVVFFDAQNLARHFFCGQQFPLTGP